MNEIEIEIKDGYVIDLSQKVWWRPIGTAPKDGTNILLFYPDLKRGIQVGSTRRSKGWAIGLTGHWHEEEPGPTHWMPLPDAPV